MSGKYFRFLDRLHNASRILGHIFTWGIFFGSVILFTVTIGFPIGLVFGIIIGSIFALFSWLGMRKSLKDAAKAREKLKAYAQGQKDVFTPTKQQSYAIYGALATGLLSFLLLFPCFVDSCKDDITRIRLFFIVIGSGVTSGFLFYEERVKGKAAIVALVILILIVAFLIGRVFALW